MFGYVLEILTSPAAVNEIGKARFLSFAKTWIEHLNMAGTDNVRSAILREAFLKKFSGI